jgi:uncharacterized protein (TIGR02271 family)
MSKTVVGLFSTFAQAQQVKQEFIAQGYDSQHVTVVANDDEELGGAASTSQAQSTGSRAKGIGEKIGSFFRHFAGGDEAAHHHYASGVNAGGALVAVTVNDPQAEEVAALLTQHGAREIEGEYATSSAPATPISTAATPTALMSGLTEEAKGETTIPLVEEQLVVGKREVDRGGVRIYSHLAERPVDASVVLREERILVERYPVSRPATAADFAAGTGAAIEMTATGEEAVVGKSSRVVEEVLIGKESSEHAETVHDTVRKTEVEVEQVAGTLRDTTINKAGY